MVRPHQTLRLFTQNTKLVVKLDINWTKAIIYDCVELISTSKL